MFCCREKCVCVPTRSIASDYGVCKSREITTNGKVVPSVPSCETSRRKIAFAPYCYRFERHELRIPTFISENEKRMSNTSHNSSRPPVHGIWDQLCTFNIFFRKEINSKYNSVSHHSSVPALRRQTEHLSFPRMKKI